jgi:hypothetical protein
LSIESLKKAYNNGHRDPAFGLDSNGGYMYTASVIERYLKFAPPAVDTQPLEDFLYYFDYENSDRTQVLLRYGNRLSGLIVALDAMMYEQVKSGSKNPYALLISAFCAGLIAAATTDARSKENNNEWVSVTLFSLIQLVDAGDDLGASDAYWFSQLFAAVVDAMSPDAMCSELVLNALSK